MIDLVIEAFEEEHDHKEDDKLEWVCESFFNFSAYESSEISENLHYEMCLFLHAVATGEYGIYTKHPKTHLIWANYFDNMRWIEWGASIRWVWFDDDIYIRAINETFTREEVEKFIPELLEWCGVEL